MDLGLKDQIAVITGGSVGIGLAVAQSLAQEGVNLVLCARDEKRVVGEASKIQEDFGVKTLGVQADVTKADDIDDLVS